MREIRYRKRETIPSTHIVLCVTSLTPHARRPSPSPALRRCEGDQPAFGLGVGGFLCLFPKLRKQLPSRTDFCLRRPCMDSFLCLLHLTALLLLIAHSSNNMEVCRLGRRVSKKDEGVRERCRVSSVHVVVCSFVLCSVSMR